VSIPAALRSTVKAIWFARSTQASEAFDEPIVPDGCVELVFNFADAFVPCDVGPAAPQPNALLVGQMTGPAHVRPTGRVDLVGVRFWPAHAGRLLRARMSDLRDQLLPAESVLGRAASTLFWEMGEASDAPGRLARLAAGLRGLGRAGSIEAPPAVTATLAAIDRTHGRVRIERLAQLTGITRRQLERQYDAHVGLRPKEYARIVRVQHALHVLRSQKMTRGADVAALCGYADQAHLIRDFRQLVGQTPRLVSATRATLSNALRSTSVAADR
jgi:AraC-like DNA-binding protein